jgi:hypothetical protein
MNERKIEDLANENLEGAVTDLRQRRRDDKQWKHVNWGKAV